MAELSVQLYRQTGPTRVSIDAEISPKGDLVISGQDLGAAPLAAFGETEYEYWLTVDAAAKDRLLLLLVARLYAGRPELITELRRWLEEVGVPYEFMTM